MRTQLTPWRLFDSRSPVRWPQGRAAVVIAASLAALLPPLLAVDLEAQTVSPGSIVLDPSTACGGGEDRVDDVCVTLPDAATCNTVDVFLLFDDTGSFQRFTTATGRIFNNVVADLTGTFPDVSFAFGVGRFEDFGGPGASFGGGTVDRPFILNQALLEASSPGFGPALTDALSDKGKGAGDGVDWPESAIEALFQVATGVGFNGNPATDSSVRESGDAGESARWMNPGPSGDVPDFASYVASKEKSGELGGAGWRADSCLRLVLLATDYCTVAPFAAGLPIPSVVEGSGASVPSSAFSCPGGTRFGFVSDAQERAANSVPGAVAPVGAATVPGTVAALNDLGIRVIGLGPGAMPTASTSPSSAPATFLSALARLTGAVDESGQPLVFDLGGSDDQIRAALVGAVESSVRAPIDITLVPDPELVGLTVTASPPVQPSVRPGEQACFSVTFAGGPGFEGGNLGLEFVNAASNGSLAMAVPATLRCRNCFDLVPRSLLCDADASGFRGSFEWTFIIRNRTDVDVHHLFFVDLPTGVSIEPRHLTFSPPIRRNQPRLVTVKIEGATPATILDFRITFHDAAIDECCAKRIELELPACDCAQLRVDRDPRCLTLPPTPPGPPWRYTFDLENLTTVPIDYLLLSPVSPVDLLTPVPPAELAIDPNVLLLDSTLAGGDETGLLSVALSGPVARPGEQTCFRISTHDATFGQCCSIVKCLTIPDCFFGAVDLTPLGSATLARTGDALIVSEIGASGEDGVAGVFDPARHVGINLQDFSAGLSLPERTFVRFAIGGTAEGEPVEVANLVATLTGGQVRVAPGQGSPRVEKVLILRGGEVIASSRQAGAVAAVGRDWPTRFVMEEGTLDAMSFAAQRMSPPAPRELITVTNIGGVAWAEPVPLRLEGGGEMLGDEVRFLFENPLPVEGLSRSDLTAAGTRALVIKSLDFGPAVEAPLP